MKIIYFILASAAIPVGAFFFVYGEYDDSPGGQLIGLVLAIIGIVYIVRRILKSKRN